MRRSIATFAMLVFALGAKAEIQQKTYYDQEWVVGGMTSCTATLCTKCGYSITTGDAVCIKVASSSSCQCTVTTDTTATTRTTKCSGSGTCTYKP